MFYKILNISDVQSKIFSKTIFILLILSFNIGTYFKTHYKNYINVAYAFDNNYEYITHVSMKSIMISQNKSTFINFYLLVSDLSLQQKSIINMIKLEHKNCDIHFFDMGKKFQNFSVRLNIWTKAIYYRICLQDLLPHEKKVIYLDTDTLIYKDLTELYNYEIDKKYYIGMLENRKHTYFEQYNTSFNQYINSGVLLCNLEELRKNNLTNKYLEFFEKFKSKISFPLNDGLNYVSNGKNGYFTPEYVVIGFCNESESFNYYNDMNIKVDPQKVLESYKNPYIYHFILFVKPWKGIANNKYHVCIDPITRFYEIARKTILFYILNKR